MMATMMPATISLTSCFPEYPLIVRKNLGSNIFMMMRTGSRPTSDGKKYGFRHNSTLYSSLRRIAIARRTKYTGIWQKKLSIIANGKTVFLHRGTRVNMDNVLIFSEYGNFG